MVLSTTAKDVTERSLLLLIFLLHITTPWGKGLGLQDSRASRLSEITQASGITGMLLVVTTEKQGCCWGLGGTEQQCC